MLHINTLHLPSSFSMFLPIISPSSSSSPSHSLTSSLFMLPPNTLFSSPLFFLPHFSLSLPILLLLPSFALTLPCTLTQTVTLFPIPLALHSYFCLTLPSTYTYAHSYAIQNPYAWVNQFLCSFVPLLTFPSAFSLFLHVSSLCSYFSFCRSVPSPFYLLFFLFFSIKPPFFMLPLSHTPFVILLLTSFLLLLRSLTRFSFTSQKSLNHFIFSVFLPFLELLQSLLLYHSFTSTLSFHPVPSSSPLHHNLSLCPLHSPLSLSTLTFLLLSLLLLLSPFFLVPFFFLPHLSMSSFLSFIYFLFLQLLFSSSTFLTSNSTCLSSLIN